jgi:VanZ family protein
MASLYACGLFWSTHAPNVRISSPGIPGIPADTFWHLAGYTGLAFLVTLSVVLGLGPKWRPLLLFVALAVIAGIDELTQHLTCRTPDLRDWCADLVGIATGISTAALCLGYFTRKQRPSGPGTSAKA